MKRETDEFGIRIFAMAAMVSDHTAVALSWLLSPSLYMLLRAFGRCAFILFAFLTAEGAAHTKNRPRYLLRLLLLALLSEPFFDLAIERRLTLSFQNTVFTLLLAVLAIELIERFKGVLLPAVFVLLAMTAAQLLKSDYGAVGVIAVLLFYFGRVRGLPPAVITVFFSVGMIFSEAGKLHFNSLFSLLSLPLLLFYNGRRGKSFGAVFYLFYPAHLLALFLLQSLLQGIF